MLAMRLSRRSLLAGALGAAVAGGGAATWALGRRDPKPDQGKWFPYQTNLGDPTLTPEQRDAIAALEALGYADGTLPPTAGRSGVMHHDRARAYAGVNFYVSGHGPEGTLVDMDGRVLHTWRYDFWDAWPDYPVSRHAGGTENWRRAAVLPDGDVLAIHEGLGILRLDRDSRLRWANPNRAHHDLQVMPDGSVYVLTRKAHLVPRISLGMPILEDFVTVLDADGVERSRVSLLEALENSRFAHFLDDRDPAEDDIFHTNTLHVLDGSIADRVPAFAKGRVLVSMLKLDLVAVVDLELRSVVWAKKGPYKRQHDPEVTRDGRVLVFDNRGVAGRSRVLELDPATWRVVWRYEGPDGDPLHSKTLGAAERLPNGNVLAIDSERGRALEVTDAGEVVWEFWNPHRAGPNQEYIAALFEVIRLPADFGAGWR